jgi:hypothetical protein
MKLTFRIDDTNTKHTRLTVFQDGGNCGKLCMDTHAAYGLITILEEADQSWFEFEAKEK